MKTSALWISILILLQSAVSFGQMDTLYLSLSETVARAQGQAPSAQIARTSFTNDYWRYRSSIADFKPLLSLNGTLPFLDRSIDELTLPNGEVAFISSSYMSNSLGIGVEQNLPLTGGRIFARSSLRRIDLFGENNRSISYLSTPIFLGLNQPIFRFNQLKWQKQLFPLDYQVAGRKLSEDMESVGLEVAQLFFRVLVAQVNMAAAERDKRNADTLFVLSEGRYSVGRISETELLQTELNVRNAEGNLARNQLELATATEQLRDYLGIQTAVAFKLEIPEETLDILIEPQEALEYARRNRSLPFDLKRRQLEAERDVARATAESGPNLDLEITFGLSQTGPEIGQAYNNLLDQEGLRLGVFVPLADYGKNKAERKIAQSNQELVNLQVQRDRVNFEREILLKSQQFELLRRQVELASRAYDIAQQRLKIVQDRYRIGNILITDLNLAISEEANARASYINDLRNYWLAYYEIRQLTLHDFSTNNTLVRNPEALLK